MSILLEDTVMPVRDQCNKGLVLLQTELCTSTLLVDMVVTNWIKSCLLPCFGTFKVCFSVTPGMAVSMRVN